MVSINPSSRGDDNSSRNTADRAAVIVRKDHLDQIACDLNDLITLVTAEISTPAATAGELRRIIRQVRNLQTKQTGTSKL